MNSRLPSIWHLLALCALALLLTFLNRELAKID